MKLKLTTDELRLRRAKLNLNQTAFAEMLGIKSRAHYSRVEKGKNRITKRLQKNYIKKFGGEFLTDMLNEQVVKRELRTIFRKTYRTPPEKIEKFISIWDNIHEHSLHKQDKKKGGEK
jgi:transcriptional regulator with XRE-family HTH domain